MTKLNTSMHHPHPLSFVLGGLPAALVLRFSADFVYFLASKLPHRSTLDLSADILQNQ
jgi:hypothetical protein